MTNILSKKYVWRKAEHGVYVKLIGSYGSIERSATIRVSFNMFPTCEIVDGNGLHVANLCGADAAKFIADAKTVYERFGDEYHD